MLDPEDLKTTKENLNTLNQQNKLIDKQMGFETESGSIRIVLIEGKRSKVYDLDYEDYEPKPSTLKKTICPENDINADGSFNIADVVCLQSFLLGKDDRAILNWMAADMYEDGVLNVFDLVCMKKALIVSAF